MTTRYVDLENGNDANDGSTFALRKKTIASACTGLTAGDTVRVMASPDPISVGINATFTNASDTVTLASAVTANIETCENAWTAAANVTATASTSSYREGTASANLVIASGFTTGLVAYKALGGPTDYSAYQQISLLVRSSINVAAGVLQLKLCSDAAGATPVDTISLPAIASGHWTPVVVDTAAALGSSIQSVALYAVSDPGSVTVNLDNIIACKASAAADALTHVSLIGKNTGDSEPWLCVGTINGTTVKVAIGNASTAAKGSYAAKYYGTTETVALYRREAIQLSAAQSFTVSGSAFSTFNVVGGWNRTDMSTRTSVTVLRPVSAGSTFNLLGSSSTQWAFVDRFIFAGVGNSGQTGVFFFQGDGHAIGACGFSSCHFGAGWSQTAGGQAVGTLWSVGCLAPLWMGGSSELDFVFELGTCWGVLNASSTGAYVVYDTVNTINAMPHVALYCDEACNVYGLAGGGTGNSVAEWEFFNTTLSDVTVLHALNRRLARARTYNLSAYSLSAIGGYDIVDVNYNKVAGNHRVVPRLSGGSGESLIETATDQRHTASDVSWRFTNAGGTNVSPMEPAVLPLGKIACVAGEARTVTLWARRSHANLVVRLTAKRGCLPGLTTVTPAVTAGAINTWEQLSIAFTPTVDGVVDIEAHFYLIAAATGTPQAWVDDMGVS